MIARTVTKLLSKHQQSVGLLPNNHSFLDWLALKLHQNLFSIASRLGKDIHE